MQFGPQLHPFAARPLPANIAVGHTHVNGPLESEKPLEVTRGMRPWFGPGGAVAAGGGNLIRKPSFATILRPPVPVNVVTGVPAKPVPPKRRRGRRWTL